MQLDPQKHYLFGLIATNGDVWFSIWRTLYHEDVIRGPFATEADALLDLGDTSEMLLEEYDDMTVEMGVGEWQPEGWDAA